MVITEDMLTHRDMTLVRACIVRELGSWTKAAVWSRIEFRAREEYVRAVKRDGHHWWRTTIEDMAEEVAISPTQLRRVLTELVQGGYIERAKHHVDGITDHTFSYRPLVASETPDHDDNFDVSNMDTSLDVSIMDTSSSYMKKEKKAGSETGQDQDLFEDWYQGYPRKSSKGAARTAFAKALKKVDLDTLHRGRDLYVAKLKMDKTEARYIKQPATWLNQECWDDDYGDVKIIPSGFEGWFDSMLSDANTAEVERVLGLVFPMPDEVPPGVDRQVFLAECRRSWLGDVKPQALSRWVVQFGDARNGP